MSDYLSFEQSLVSALSNIQDKFHTGELAYCVLTGGAESAVRDKLSFTMQRQFVTNNEYYIASKEWRRIDLCVIDLSEGLVQTVIQIKACYTHDFLLGHAWSKYLRFAGEDNRKAGKQIRKYSPMSDPDYYHLLLVSDTMEVPNATKGIITYENGIRRVFKKFAEEKSRRKILIDRVTELFSEYPVVIADVIDAGEEFRLRVNVHYWLWRMPSPNTI